MTALTQYARLEASGLWRATPEDQRREVVVSIGDATLTITDMRDQPLAHWSLAAIHRANPGKRPAVFHPEGDSGETLELAVSEAQMIDALEKLRRAVDRARPRPGRLRGLGLLVSVTLVALLAWLWLPGALVRHTVAVVPDVKRAEIGSALLERIERLTGPACAAPAGLRALQNLRARLGTGPVIVLPGDLVTSLHLPGGTIVIDRALVEDYEEPDVAAGFILAEAVLSQVSDPFYDLLDAVGPRASFQLLTTGNLKGETLDLYARHLLTQPSAQPADDELLAAFETRGVRSTPYAYARDVTGETVLGLIEADPMARRETAPLLSDADWLRLQSICGA